MRTAKRSLLLVSSLLLLFGASGCIFHHGVHHSRRYHGHKGHKGHHLDRDSVYRAVFLDECD